MKHKYILISLFLLLLFICIAIFTFIIFAINIPDYHGRINEKIDKIEKALNSFYNKYNRYPSKQEGLVVLYEFLENDLSLEDPWENPYQYIPPTPENNYVYGIFSMGPDGEAETLDDFTSWSE